MQRRQLLNHIKFRKKATPPLNTNLCKEDNSKKCPITQSRRLHYYIVSCHYSSKWWLPGKSSIGDTVRVDSQWYAMIDMLMY